MTKKKGVHKGENFPPCTEEDAFPSSVSFPFYIFSILFYLRRRLYVFVYAVGCLFFLPQLVFVLFFVLCFWGLLGGKYPPNCCLRDRGEVKRGEKGVWMFSGFWISFRE